MPIINSIGELDNIDPIKHAMDRYEGRSYVRIGSDMSVTEIIDSPRVVQLRQRHPDKLLPSVAKGTSSALLGTAVHDAIQKPLREHDLLNPGSWLVERRLLSVMQCDSGRIVRVAGRFDMLQDRHILWDIKRTSTFKFRSGKTDDFEKQLNIYCHMLRQDGINIDEAWILANFKDWNVKDATKFGVNYPPGELVAYQFGLWSPADQRSYFEDRVNAHDAASVCPDQSLPKCTPDETWARASRWTVRKDLSSPRATRVFDEKHEAESFALEKNIPPDNIKERLGYRTRCEEWCKCRDICSQYAEFKSRRQW